MLQEKLYPSDSLEVIGWLATEFGRNLFLWSLDHFVGILVPIPPDRKNIKYYLTSLPWLPLYGCILLIALVLKILLFPAYVMTNSYKTPYTIKRISNADTTLRGMKYKGDFTICTANICALTETVAHFTGVKDTLQRCREIGKKIANSGKDVKHADYHQCNDHLPGNHKKQNITFPDGDTSHVSLMFPENIDFFCFQETSELSLSASSTLAAELSTHFNHFVYNVGLTGWKTYFHVFDSGLMVASRYPILDVYYQPFSRVYAQLQLASFGVVAVKVDLGITKEEKSAVGFIANTHLQSYQGKDPIHQIQMNEILQWQEEFRTKSLQDGEVIAFDILCGDFNFDNMSPGEEADSKHRLFDVYEDVCRERPGKDHSWCIGTEIRLPTLWDEAISTPEKMKQTLDDPEMRSQYLYDADIKGGMTFRIAYTHPDILRKEKAGQNDEKEFDINGKRRIDVILYRKENAVEVTDLKFVTQLARLTDHIPVSMTFKTNL
ncbi:sphingomyelin phosphodiesterase 5-like [Ptychodera flava]|uniref:sphingomyelin phosphodiesterase 5-like n=1 Tax=Ptychodera flava TaxID=63121 RepID=UPI00396A1C89